MRVVVIGGGYAGLASAVRLAKLGHAVTLLERGDELGGAMRTVRHEGYAWQAGPSYTLLPAVVRDLFRKSGRPLERELELVQVPVVTEHWFPDGSEIALPSGRGAQAEAFDGLRPGLGAVWTAYVDGFAEDWEVLRTEYAENPWRRDERSSRELAARLDSREMLDRRLKRAFGDERQRLVAGHRFVAAGHALRNVPAWAGLEAYLEAGFGLWTVPDGMSRLTEALVDRLATREVRVLTRVEALDVVVRGGRAVAVSTVGPGEIEADAVVCAIDPRRLPALARYVERTLPAIPPMICHLGFDGPLDDSIAAVPSHEIVVHGDPTITLRPGGSTPHGGSALTVSARVRDAEDMLRAAAKVGLDLTHRQVTRLDRKPAELVQDWGGSPLGVLWQGRGTVRTRLGPTTPIPGVYAAGASATPGAGLPFVGLSAAQVATLIGPA